MKPMLHGTACAVGDIRLWGLRLVFQDAFSFLEVCILRNADFFPLFFKLFGALCLNNFISLLSLINRQSIAIPRFAVNWINSFEIFQDFFCIYLPPYGWTTLVKKLQLYHGVLLATATWACRILRVQC